MSRKGLKIRKKHILQMIAYSLILGLCIAVIIGFTSMKEQMDISSKIVRLHVVPNSDSIVDQQLKETVRQNVTENVNELLREISDIGEAERVLSDNIENIEQSARDLVLREGYTYSVCAELKDEVFSTREYDTFTLPAGKYRSLKVTIGDGRGENWWCVVFPPLCFTGEVEFYDVAEAAGLTEGEIKLISNDSKEGVIFKFQILEIIKRLKEYL